MKLKLRFHLEAAEVMMRIFGKSCACNCSGTERPVETGAPDAPIDTQHYRSYKEQVLQVGRPNSMTVTRQSEEAIFEVVAPSDVEDPRRPCGRHGHGALCSLTVVVQESSLYVRILCVLSAVALVLLSSLGALLTMADGNNALEVILSAWVWLVFAWIYAVAISLSELKPQCPNCTESYQAGIYKAVPLLALQVGRSCFHFAVGFQCLLFRPLYLSIPCGLCMCFTGTLLLIDTKFRCGARGSDDVSRDKKLASLRSQVPKATDILPRLALPESSQSS